MKHLQDLATPVNKFANTIRLIGLLLALCGTVGLLSYSAGKTESWDFFKSTMLHLAIAGAILTLLGDLLWKILLKNSDVTRRQFYFHDEE